MFFYANGAHPRASATMWNTKCFVKVYMRYIGADIGRFRYANLGVKISPVHIDLPTISVDHFTNLFNRLFVNSMCGWIGNH